MPFNKIKSLMTKPTPAKCFLPSPKLDTPESQVTLEDTPEQQSRKPQQLQIDTNIKVVSKDLSSLSLGQLALVMDNTSSPKKLVNAVRPFKMRKFTPDEDLECDEEMSDDEKSPKI